MGDEPRQAREAASASPAIASAKLRFSLMVSGAIVISCVLVGLSLQLYAWSGAAQLDLSLPEYDSLRQQIETDTGESFSASGSMDSAAVDDFLKLFDKQLEQTEGGTGFSSRALSDESLGITMPKE